MVRSKASTVDEYLDSLPPDRREVVSRVRDVILDNLPEGYQETMNWGMISYEIPMERYQHSYNGQPLSYAALGAQKNYYSLYLMATYTLPGGDAWLRAEFEKAGKKLDMGKSCVRFKKLDDLPLDVIGRAIAATPPDDYIARYEEGKK